MQVEKPFQVKGLLVWILCTIFFLYEFFLRTVIGTFQINIMKDLALSSFQYTLLSTALFSLVFGLMQIPVGFIVRAWGLKRTLLFASFCCAFSSLMFSYSPDYTWALLSRMLMGLGASFGFVCLLLSIYRWLPQRNTALFIGISQFIGTLGPMLATGPLDNYVAITGMTWRTLFFDLSFIGLIIFFLILFFFDSDKKGLTDDASKHQVPSQSVLKLLSRSQPWLIAICCGCLYFTIEYLSENEGKIFLQLKGCQSGSYLLTIAWLGYAIGCPLFGFISDLIQKRRPILIFTSLIGFMSLSIILTSCHESYLKIAFLLLGLSASGQGVGFALMAEQFRKQDISVGLGLNNAVITAFTAVNAPLMGFFLDKTKTSQSITLEQYLYIFNIPLIIMFLACLLSMIFVKESYCRHPMTR